MSLKHISWASRTRVGDPAAKAVLIALCDCADEHGYSFPSLKHISEFTEQSVRTIQRAILKLEEIGFITREERRRKDGYKTSDGYQINTSVDIKSHDTVSDDKLSHDNVSQSQVTPCPDNKEITNPQSITLIPPVSPKVKKREGERLEKFMEREFPDNPAECPQPWGEEAVAKAREYRSQTKADFTKLVNWHFGKFS
jgi:DNA-binding transcriptional MocR family regulator